MEPLDPYLEKARLADREGFSQTYPDPVLLLAVPRSSGEEWSGFRTTRFTLESVRRLDANAPTAANYRVLAIRKSANNPWSDRISLGRASNNDLVLRDGSVSKLHAHFVVGVNDEVVLRDAGSSNGTLHNGRKLDRSEQVSLHAGDVVRLGNVDVTFCSSAAFFDFLRDLDGVE